MTDDLVDTGLAGLDVTAAVTEPSITIRDADPPAPHVCHSTTGTRCDICFGPVAHLPVVIPSEPMPDGWTINRVAALVRDLAMNMYDVRFILKKHVLSDEQYETLRGNDFFRRALEAATIEWNSPQSTPKRLAMEAAIALEDALPDVASRLKKANEPLPGVVELCKLFAKMAGVGEQVSQGAPQEKFKITINLGADVAQFEKQRVPILTVQTEPEGPGGDAPLQQFLQAP